MKLISVFFLVASFFECSAQASDVKLEHSLQQKDSLNKRWFQLNLSLEAGDNEISILHPTSLTEFKCNLNAAIWLDFEVLTENCFTIIGSDCNPTYAPAQKVWVSIAKGRSLKYCFDITNYLHKNYELVYRYRIFYQYRMNSQLKTANTNWVYLTLKN